MVCDTTTRPARASTSTATRSSRTATPWIASTARDRCRTSKLCNSSGSRTPLPVRNVTSTLASDANGFSITSHCCTPRGVVPAAKYHDLAAAVAHVETSTPACPSMLSSTTTRPPNDSTVSAPGGPRSARFFVITDEASTRSVCGGAASLSPSTVTTTSAGAGSMLLIVTRTSAAGSAGGRPGQNHAVSRSAPAGGERGRDARGCGAARVPSFALPATTAATSAATSTATKNSARRGVMPIRCAARGRAAASRTRARPHLSTRRRSSARSARERNLPRWCTDTVALRSSVNEFVQPNASSRRAVRRAARACQPASEASAHSNVPGPIASVRPPLTLVPAACTPSVRSALASGSDSSVRMFAASGGTNACMGSHASFSYTVAAGSTRDNVRSSWRPSASSSCGWGAPCRPASGSERATNVM